MPTTLLDRYLTALKNNDDADIRRCFVEGVAQHNLVRKEEKQATVVTATALSLAVEHGSVIAVEEALKHGCSPEELTGAGKQRPALMWATALGQWDVAERLLSHGCDANQRDAVGNTSLHEAVAQWNTAWIDLLLAHGADLEAKNVVGESPYWCALYHGLAGVVDHLMQKGADVHVQTNQGYNGAFAVALGHDMMVNDGDARSALLRRWVATRGDIDGEEKNDGDTALRWAVKDRNATIIRALLAAGADVLRPSSNPQDAASPWECAERMASFDPHPQDILRNHLMQKERQALKEQALATPSSSSVLVMRL